MEKELRPYWERLVSFVHILPHKTGENAMMISAIIFGRNVLVKSNEERACQKLAEWSPLPATKIRQEIFIGPLKGKYDRREITSMQFYMAAKAMMQVAGQKPSYDDFRFAWGDIFTEHPGFQQAMKRIDTAIELFFMANTNDIHWQYLKELGIVEKIFGGPKQQILSHYHKRTTEMAGFYSKAIAQTGHQRSQILYINNLRQPLKTFELIGGQALFHDTELEPTTRSLLEKLQQLGIKIHIVT
jgi:hypothetical protein